MNKLKAIIQTLKNVIIQTVKRYPLAVVLFFMSSVVFMIVIQINSGSSKLDDEVFMRIGLSLIYSAILSLVFKSLSERFKLKSAFIWAGHSLVFILGAVVFFLVIPDFDSAISVIRYFLLCSLTASLFFFFPFIKSEKSASYFAQKVFLRLAVTMIYYGIITGGVEAIIFAVENLLAVNVPSELYGHAAVIIAGLFIPSFFFAGIPQKDDPDGEYAKLIKILLHYIAYILLAAYSLVLYIYFIKILIVFELPSNELGNLVIYYSLISIAVLYFGWYTKDENRWTKIFHKFFPYIMIIPTLMMIVSFWVRINQYGFTEPRYYAILAAIFVLRSISVIKLQKKVRLIPLVISVLMLISIFGPLSAFSVSKWSQNRRFEKILIEADMLEDGNIVKKPDADDETKYEVTEIVSYFISNHKSSDIKYIDNEFRRSDMKDIFGFEAFYSRNMNRDTNYYYIDSYKSGITDIKGYDVMVNIYTGKIDEDFLIEKDSLKITTVKDESGLYLLKIYSNEEEIYTKDMGNWLIPLTKENSGDRDGVYSFKDDNDIIKVKIILDYANYYESEDELYYSAKLLVAPK